VLLVRIKKKNDQWNSGPDSEELSILSQPKSTMHKIEAWLGCVKHILRGRPSLHLHHMINHGKHSKLFTVSLVEQLLLAAEPSLALGP
jgi:hypothetical protein